MFMSSNLSIHHHIILKIGWGFFSFFIIHSFHFFPEIRKELPELGGRSISAKYYMTIDVAIPWGVTVTHSTLWLSQYGIPGLSCAAGKFLLFLFCFCIRHVQMTSQLFLESFDYLSCLCPNLFFVSLKGQTQGAQSASSAHSLY